VGAPPILARAIQNVNLVGAAILAAIHFGVFVALLSLWDLSLVIPMGALDYALVTIDPPPLNWSDSKYGFLPEEDCDAEEIHKAEEIVSKLRRKGRRLRTRFGRLA
jgi:hypothetical protein